MKIGFIGILRDELKEDYFGTLEKAAALGYEGFEIGLKTIETWPLPVAQMRERLDALGLQIVTCHTNAAGMNETFAANVQNLHAIGCRYASISWGPCDSKEQLLRDAETYNALGQRLKSEGIALCYHNHDHEFARFDGEYGFDILLGSCDPQAVQAHIDIMWVTYGGADPIEIIQKYAGRCPLIHAKDVVQLEPGCEQARGDRQQAKFTEVGTGIVDLQGCVKAAYEAGAQWIVVEQDRPGNLPPFDSLRVSCENLKRAVDSVTA
jgi:sugar phosphate isomerase/epimerase